MLYDNSTRLWDSRLQQQPLFTCCLFDNPFELCSKLNSIYICVICYRWAHTSVSNLANLKVLDGEMNYKCVINEISV